MAGSHIFERWSACVEAWTRVAGARHAVGPALSLDQLRRACDRLSVRVADAREHEALRRCATELRFLSLHADRLAEATAREYGERPEVQAAAAAFGRVRDALARTASLRSAAGVSFVARRNTLYDALGHLRYGLMSLGWVRLKKPPRSTLTG